MSQYYKKYMKKREEEKPSYAKLFIGAFLLMVVFFITVATHLTLSVDTTIGENDEGDIKESGLGVKHLIDSRLRLIQMEDAGKVTIKDNIDKKPTLDNFDKAIEPAQDNSYKGQYQQSYGYNQTQQTQPYSQTYNNTQKTVATPSATPKPTTTATRPASVPVQQSAPTPKGNPATLHQLQNLTPTGMN